MRHTDVSIDLFSSMYWWYVFAFQMPCDLKYVMIIYAWICTWLCINFDTISHDLHCNWNMSPHFQAGWLHLPRVWKTYTTILKICLQTPSVYQNTSDLFSAFDSFIRGWEPETTGARNKWTWNVESRLSIERNQCDPSPRFIKEGY